MTYGNNQRIDADKQFANVPKSLFTGASPALNLGANGTSALDVQVGGGHYKSKAIQPVEYSAANNLNFLEGCIVKRITRWRDKNGIEDLLKIKHEVDLLIELETRYPRGKN